MILFLLIVMPQKLWANDGKEFELENLKITINLEKILQNGNKLKICLPEEPLKLISEEVQVNGQTINELLLANNIRPDYEAYGIVYNLNPNIKDLGEITLKQIKLPKIQGGEFLKHLFEYNFKIHFIADKKLKEELIAENKKLNLLIIKASDLDITHFSSSNIKADYLNKLKSTSDLLNGINTSISKGFGPPIPREVLERLLKQVGLLQSDINSVIFNKKKINLIELEQITAINKDLKIKAGILIETASARPPRSYPKVKVIVKTMRNGQEISNYRIFYVAEAYKRRLEMGEPIGKLSSPTDKSIDQADWCFWAAKDPDRNPISNMVCEEVREESENIVIELTLNP